MPVIRTGKVPESKINPDFFLFSCEFKKGLKPQQHQKKGSQFAKPIQERFELSSQGVKLFLNVCTNELRIIRTPPARKKRFNLSCKNLSFLFKVLIIKDINNNIAAMENAEGNKNNPI